jgi:hypothetical protein
MTDILVVFAIGLAVRFAVGYAVRAAVSLRQTVLAAVVFGESATLGLTIQQAMNRSRPIRSNRSSP